MQTTHLVREIDVPKSFRVSQVASLFDVPLKEKVRHEWNVALPLDARPWQIGLILGPSGCGKTTIARDLWPDAYVRSYPWNAASILDAFPQEMESKEIVNLLTSVGFSSPPDWVKPYHALSTGQQMRADLARALADHRFIVFDEFTSVVDRTVAQIGSAALARAIRRAPDRQFIAVTCHEDVLDWLTPDWTYEPHTGSFEWRCLRRPEITLDLYQSHPQAWRVFGPHHYMSATLNPSAVCYVAWWGEHPVGFQAVLPVIGFNHAYRSSRTVILPDYQGIGLGSRFSDAVAQLYLDRGMRYRDTLSHPALIAHYQHSGKWKMVSVMPSGTKGHSKVNSAEHRAVVHSSNRSVVTFEYVGDGRPPRAV